jgi:hypothetical protein
MRIIISAIALALTIGVALPAPSDARPPPETFRWNCAFSVEEPWYQETENSVDWVGLGSLGGCDRKHRFVVRLTIVEMVPGRANRVLSRRKIVKTFPRGSGKSWEIRGGACTPDGAAPTRFPVYTRMQVKRVGKPGIVRVTSRNNRNPCRNVENIFPWFTSG